MRRFQVVRVVLSIAAGAGLAAASDAGATDFSDRDLLIETFSLDEARPLARAQAELGVAESERDAAQAALDATDPLDLAAVEAATLLLEQKQAVYEQKLAAVQAIEHELEQTATLVGELSDAQVHALNASLQNARKTGLLPLSLDADDLQAILDGGWGMPEIAALTHALEAEARFDRIAERFEERAEATGDDRFAEKAERFEARGDAREERFQDKVEAMDARREAREAAKEAAAEHSHGLAKGKGH